MKEESLQNNKKKYSFCLNYSKHFAFGCEQFEFSATKWQVNYFSLSLRFKNLLNVMLNF